MGGSLVQASNLELIQVTLKAPKMGCGTRINCKVPFRIIPRCLDFLPLKKKNQDVREKKQKNQLERFPREDFLDDPEGWLCLIRF